MSTWVESDPTSQPTRNLIYARIDNGNGTFSFAPVAGTLNSDGLATLLTSGSGGGGGGGTSNTVAATNAGTTATTANPVQGVTGGVPMPVSGTVAVTGTFYQATQPVSIATLPSLAAGTSAIGQVGGKTTTVDVTPTVTASSAYTAGNVVGGVLTFTNALQSAGTGLLQSITLKLKSAQTATFKLYVFKAVPTTSTFNDKAAPSITAADIPSLTGVYTLAGYDSGLGTHTIYNIDGIGKVLAPGTTTLYGVLVTVNTPTFASSSDMTVSIGILQD